MSFARNTRVVQKVLTALIRPTALLALIAGLFDGRLAAAQTARSVALVWDANPDPVVLGYRVYYGTSSGNYSQSTDVGNLTGTTIPNLTAGETYYFAVTDYDTAKRSDTARFARFFWAMMDRGVYLPCSQFEAAFLSAVHTDKHVETTLAAAREALAEISR